MHIRLIVLMGLLAVGCGGANGRGALPPTNAESSGSGAGSSANQELGKPAPDDLAPIAIPVSTLKTTAFSGLLKKACEDLDAKKIVPKVGDFNPETAAPERIALLAAVKAANIARQEQKKTDPRLSAEADARKAFSSKVGSHLEALAHACAAIRDASTKFEDKDIEVLAAFKRQPEVAEAFVTLAVAANPVTTQGESLSSTLSVGSLGSTIIEGLSRFVYDRAKAEAIGYVATRLKNLLCGTHEDYFNHLCVAFEDLDATSLTAIGTYLGTAARKDLVRIPDVAMAYEIYSQAKSDCSDCNKLVAARLAYAYFIEAAGGRRALDVARSLHKVTLTPTQLAKGAAAIRVVGFASAVLDAIMQQDKWTRTRAAELPYFVVAVAFTVHGTAKTHDPGTKWAVTADSLNSNMLRDLQGVVQKVLDAHARLEKILEAIESARESNLDASAVETLTGLGRKDLAQVTSLSLTDVIGGSAELLKNFEAGDDTADIVAIVGKFARFGQLLVSDNSVAEVGVGFVDFADLILERSKNAHIAGIRKALPIVTQLAKAKSSDEVVKVLEAAALPIGGYKLKSETPRVTLTAFAGVAGGLEFLPDHGLDGSVSAFAPVGLHLTTPWWGNGGLLVSILNLGNLISTRIDADTKPETEGNVTTAVSDNQTFAPLGVFSPGVFVTKSFGKSPFAFGAGAQVVPDAREIKTTVVVDEVAVPSSEQRAVVQFLLFVGVDVSIFAF